ncbi:hypothetical protein FJY93_02400 [Candidatus Kaiserbacteria bacterium]|nr:hypothetical protein [Candidatus Kaiserbacteria bacterium]
MDATDLETWGIFRKNLQEHVDKLWEQKGGEKITITAPMTFVYIQTGFKDGPVHSDPRTEEEVHKGVMKDMVRKLEDNVYGPIEAVRPEPHPFLDKLAIVVDKTLSIFAAKSAGNGAWTKEGILDSFAGWTTADTNAALSTLQEWNIVRRLSDGRWVRDYEVMSPEDRPDRKM